MAVLFVHLLLLAPLVDSLALGSAFLRRAARPARAIGAVAQQADRDVDDLLDLLSSLHVSRQEVAHTALGTAPGSSAAVPTQLVNGVPQPTGVATHLSTNEVARVSKKILAAPTSILSRQQALAALSTEALASGRPRSARLLYELAARRVSKWRATNSSAAVARELVVAGLLAMCALRDCSGYEGVLSAAQDQWECAIIRLNPLERAPRHCP